MASLVCSKTDEELPSIFNPKNVNLEAIERPGENTASKRMKRLQEHGSPPFFRSWKRSKTLTHFYHARVPV